MEDERVPAVAGFVRQTPDGGAHWNVSGIAGARQLMIHVVTKTHHTPIWCHAQGGGKLSHGLWSIPSVGTEVLVSFDNGAFEGDAFIIGEFGRYDDSSQSLAENTTLLIDETVEIRSVAGSAVALALKSDVTSLANFVQGLLVGGTGSVVVPPGSVPQPVGTTVLKAE